MKWLNPDFGSTRLSELLAYCTFPVNIRAVSVISKIPEKDLYNIFKNYPHYSIHEGSIYNCRN